MQVTFDGNVCTIILDEEETMKCGGFVGDCEIQEDVMDEIVYAVNQYRLMNKREV